MKIEVVVASEKHLSYVTAINDAIDHAAKARGTGIARRTNEYIADKIRSGKAITALNREEFAVSAILNHGVTRNSWRTPG